jgi:hypothetical protein
VLVKAVAEIPASTQMGRDALTTAPDAVGDYDEDDDGGVPVEDVPIPADGLDVDDGSPQIPLEGLDVGDDIAIPADGLALTDEQVAELERHETGEGEDPEESL